MEAPGLSTSRSKMASAHAKLDSSDVYVRTTLPSVAVKVTANIVNQRGAAWT